MLHALCYRLGIPVRWHGRTLQYDLQIRCQNGVDYHSQDLDFLRFILIFKKEENLYKQRLHTTLGIWWY